MALAWIYLKTFGQMTEPLCDELFWVFKKEDFKHALACFIFEDGGNYAENDETNILLKNIKMRFDKFIAIPTNLAKRPRTRKRGGTENSANLLGLPEYEGTIADWAKEMYTKVNLRHNQTGLRLQGRMMTSCVGFMTHYVGFAILP